MVNKKELVQLLMEKMIPFELMVVLTPIGEIRSSDSVGTMESAFDRFEPPPNARTSFRNLGFNEVRSNGISSIKTFIEGNVLFLHLWNDVLVVLCIIATSLDPLFCYVLVVDENSDCIGFDRRLRTAVVVLRSIVDFVYIILIVFHFLIGYNGSYNATDRVDCGITWRSFLSSFTVDILAVFPLPQVLVSLVIPILKGYRFMVTMRSLKFILLVQYLPRVFRIYSFSKKARFSSGILPDTAEIKAVFNLFLYLLASYVIGAFWYLFSVERKATCWQENCRNGQHCLLNCNYSSGERLFMAASCSAKASSETVAFDFGMFGDAFKSGVVSSSNLMWKISYCYWWGLRNLSSLGQNLQTSNYIWEIYFAVTICISGVVLFALLIGNLQTFLQARVARLEKMRLKRQDIKVWMSNNFLPRDLKKRIKQYEQGVWRETRSVDIENFLNNLPRDLQRDIKRHRCLGAISRVPMFEKMDEQFMDAICYRLKSVLYTENSDIVQEGDRVEEMLFIMRGKLLAIKTNGGRSGFFDSHFLMTGDFCGEEVLTWALVPRSSPDDRPVSTRTIRTLTEVEAFALKADDLKLVASQFCRVYSQQLRHTYRFYSQQWRTWAACFIQEAWRRHCKRKLEKSLREEEKRLKDALARAEGSSASLGATIKASSFAANMLRAIQQESEMKAKIPERMPSMGLEKPAEPDFTYE